MKLYKIIFYLFVCFNLIILNVEILPTFNDKLIKFVLILVTLSYGIIIIKIGLDNTIELEKEEGGKKK